MQYTNPIIRGFNPDPSICRVGTDYYLVTSSFAYFPGIPLYHSTDLVNWEMIGHCIERKGILPFDKAESPGGIWAPTIRYHEGTFYVTATFSRHGNFIVSATDPVGPWSDPVWTEVDGIDPSMYFENGNVYYCTNDSVRRRAELGVGTEGISLCQVDVSTGKVIGERRRIWSGTGEGWLESPHVYRIGEYYYLMCAEGGTGLQHMVTIARSKNLFGPFESYMNNPILTNRNDTTKQVVCAGHADLFEDASGNWWLVHLGCRTNINMHSNIGRETFLMPCTWIDQWPVVLPDRKSRIAVDGPVSSAQKPAVPFIPDFSRKNQEKEWLFLREPEETSCARRNSELIIHPTTTCIDDKMGSPGFICIRQTELSFRLDTVMRYTPKESSDEAGLAIYLDSDFCYLFSITLIDKQPKLILRRHIDDIRQTVVLTEIDTAQDISLSITADSRNYCFLLNGKMLTSASTRFMSKDVPDRCFTGTMLGIFTDGKTDLRVKSFAYYPEYS